MLRSKLILPGLAIALAGGAFAQDGTDTCTTPTAIGEGSFAFDTTTMLGSDDLTGCNSNLVGAGPYFYQDMFWVYTATVAGDLLIDTEGSSFDTQLAIHSGIDCAAVCVDNDDDDGTGLLSTLTLYGVNIGDQYVIQVGGWGTGAGFGMLNVTSFVAPPIHPNNDCSAAATITGTGAFPFDTSGATSSGFDGGGGTCSNTNNQDIFMQWTAPAAGDYLFDTFGSPYDTKLSVHTGIGCAATCGDYNDDTNGLQSQVSLSGLAMGDSVLIQVGGYMANFGPGTLNIASWVDPCSSGVDDSFEDNDDCANAVTMATGYHPNLFLADLDPDNYSITIPAGEILNVTVVLISGDVDINLYDNTCFLIGGGVGTLLYSNITGAPQTVVVEIINYPFSGANCAEYDLDVSTAPDPCQTGSDDTYEENDDCASAAPVGDGTITGLFITATDKDHYSTCVGDGDTIDVDILFLDAQADMDLFLWDAADYNCGTGYGTTDLANGFSVTDNETISWTNLTGASLDVVIEVQIYSGDCNDYDLVVSGSDCSGISNAGTPFCDPAANNSTGAPAILAGTWGSGVGSDLHLEITSGVPGQLAYFLVGTEATAGIAVSNGLFCLVGTSTAQFFRYNVGGTDMNSIGGFDATGTMINSFGTSTTGFGFDVPSTIPASPVITITAGNTWHFQGWYRDTPAGVGTSNFTNGLSVTF